MNGLLLLLIGMAVFVAAYVIYARLIARWLGLDDSRPTPAHTMADGIDYVPAHKPVLLGHHFASIAGAAPIIGPVLAARYGWLPVFVWIVIGSVFLGAVHDFTSLVASVRHRGRSIGIIIEQYLGSTGKLLFLLFAWATLILVIAVFTLVVARTFVSTPAVATASILFIILAIGFGLFVYRFKANFMLASAVGVLLLGFCLYIGVLFPFPRLFAAAGDGDPMQTFWQIVLLLYIFVASVAPVNILLQPRDYLNSFLLYGILLLSVLAVVVAPPAIEAPAFVAWDVQGLGPLFPLLFVTVACGAISGFHSMVASGTTAKQLDKETDAKAVGYGAMVIESLLAVLALVTAVVLTKDQYSALLAGGSAVTVFATGVAGFLQALSIPVAVGVGFAGLAVSAFALTSLDTATRLARFSLQELAMKSGLEEQRQNILYRNRFLATGVTVAVSAVLIFSGKTMSIWQIFGSANQLLAAMALMAVATWLASTGRRTLFVVVPMIFMFLVATGALGMQIYKFFFAQPSPVLGVIAALLFVLSLLLAYNYARRIVRGPTHEDSAHPEPR